MRMLMCRSCGSFLPAYRDGDTVVPFEDACPECGGTEFKDNENDEVIETD